MLTLYALLIIFSANLIKNGITQSQSYFFNIFAS